MSAIRHRVKKNRSWEDSGLLAICVDATWGADPVLRRVESRNHVAHRFRLFFHGSSKNTDQNPEYI